ARGGEAARPLARVASGGELSRIMLALKLSLRRADPVATYVFDEVDAGVGGGAAEVVGRQIRRVAESRQVLCVTHLPQIAALADTQFRVEKYEKNGRTETRGAGLQARERRGGGGRGGGRGGEHRVQDARACRRDAVARPLRFCPPRRRRASGRRSMAHRRRARRGKRARGSGTLRLGLVLLVLVGVNVYVLFFGSGNLKKV